MKENFFKGNYGVFTHYLTVAATTSEAWNARTAQYDAKGLAKQLHEAGAKWLFFTLASFGPLCGAKQHLRPHRRRASIALLQAGFGGSPV